MDEPGKKLLFMGGEFAQWHEWSHEGSIDWHLLQHAPHAGIERLIGDLNALYRGRPALHQRDCVPEGFEWIDASDAATSVVSYLRKADGAPPMLVVANLTPVVRRNYRVGVPTDGRWQEVLNTDAERYGGSGQGNLGGVEAAPMPWHGRPASLNISLPPLSVVCFEPEG